MSSSIKDKITTNLKQAKTEGQLRTDKIQEIVQEAVSQTRSEIKEGSSEIRTVVQDAVSAVIEELGEKGEQLKENITASIEGVIEGISRTRRQAITKTQLEVKQLQDKLETEEQELQDQIDTALSDISETSQDKSEQVKAAVESAIETIQNSEEVTLMKKRYAQLKAQLAIVQANLSARYGEQYEQVQGYLDEAKTWYDKAKEDPEVFTEKVDQKRQDFEQKLGEIASAIAKKEQQLQHRLKELWDSLLETFSSASKTDQKK